jgi:CRP-like cAMP-binding protein
MPNAFARKLRRFADFNPEEIAALVAISSDPEPRRRGSDLIRQGDRSDVVQILLSGWACRYKVLDDGRRQILAYLLPGDLCDLHVSLLNQMDHNIGLLSPATVVAIPFRDIHATMERFTKIERAIWCASLADEAILREWLVSVGRRDAIGRVGHRLCELRYRMQEVGLVDRTGEFDLPLSQEDLADSLGLSSVHVNRILTRLRGQGLVLLNRRRLTIAQPERLAELSGFDPSYLHPCAPPPPEARISGSA